MEDPASRTDSAVSESPPPGSQSAVPAADSAQPIRTPQSEIRNSTIHILSAAVTSRIAAGEVVERPASVVKELVENALDAGATQIGVELSGGGRTRIRVSDNGRGMSRADLGLCCLPHATSKIASADDLEALNTLGFRGEALPSIAAVSHFSITSRLRAKNENEGEAWRIEIDGGEPERPQPKPAAHAGGSSVEVRELFYNLPARAKFMKGDAAEAAACADILLRLALTRPDVAFTLHQERHELFSFPACCASGAAASGPGQTAPLLPLSAYQRRGREVLGRQNSQGLIELAVEGPGERSRESGDESRESNGGSSGLQTPDARLSDSFTGYRLYGLISPPAVTRPNRSSIFLTVNGRAVKDRLLTSALLESYRHLLPPKRFPAAVLFLEVPAPDVDINVHPTKSEVRFRLSGLVYALLHNAVRSACGIKASAESPVLSAESQALNTQHSAPSTQHFVPSKSPLGAPRVETNQRTFDLWQGERLSPESGTQKAEGRGRQADFGLQSADRGLEARPALSEPAAPERETQQSGLSTQHPLHVAEAAPAYANPQSAIRTPQSPVPAIPHSPFKVLGQAGGAYIVLEDDSGVKLIDQHALHERILFEELLARAEGRSRGDSQGLLIAETLELTPVQAAYFAQDQAATEVLKNIGFEVESFGPRTIAVRAVPAILPANAAALVRDVLDALAQANDDTPGARTPASRAGLREKAAYILSCKGAIKAGERLTLEQMSALIVEFRKKVGRGAFTCPHGRPLAVELSWEELERGVGRR